MIYAHVEVLYALLVGDGYRTVMRVALAGDGQLCPRILEAQAANVEAGHILTTANTWGL